MMFYLTLGFIVALLVGMVWLVYFDQDELSKEIAQKLEEEGEDYDYVVMYYIYK